MFAHNSGGYILKNVLRVCGMYEWGLKNDIPLNHHEFFFFLDTHEGIVSLGVF